MIRNATRITLAILLLVPYLVVSIFVVMLQKQPSEP